MSPKWIGAMLLASMAGCAASDPTSTLPSPQAESASHLRVARDLLAAGRPLEATFYYEAALADGAASEVILPELCVADAGAGRLREARRRLDQLVALDGTNLAALELRQVLERLLGSAP